MAITMKIVVRGDLPNPDAIRAGLAQGVQTWLEQVREGAQALAPKRTGKLAREMRVVMGRTGRKGQGKNIRGRITMPFYGPILEVGAVPHEIVAKPGKLLRFTVGDKTIFTRKVHHPGFAAKPFLRPSAEQRLPDLKTTIEDILRPIVDPPVAAPATPA